MDGSPIRGILVSDYLWSLICDFFFCRRDNSHQAIYGRIKGIDPDVERYK
jgi:hypothetical protein